METIPVSRWEYVSAYYSLSFQNSTLLGFIVRGTLPGVRPATNRRRLHPKATISPNSRRNGGARDRREMCAAVFVPRSRFCPLLYSFLCVPEMAARWMLQFQPQPFLPIRKRADWNSASGPCKIPNSWIHEHKCAGISHQPQRLARNEDIRSVSADKMPLRNPCYDDRC